jgi:hypothetical protein
MTRTIFAIIMRLIVLGLSVSAIAQTLPDAPSRTHSALKIAAVGLIGMDAWATNRNFEDGHGQEINPVARQCMNHGSGVRAGYFAAGAAAFWLTDRTLTRKGHKRMAMVLDLGVIGAEAYWTGYSIRNHR